MLPAFSITYTGNLEASVAALIVAEPVSGHLAMYTQQRAL